MKTTRGIAFTGHQRAELCPVDLPEMLLPHQVRGRTLATLISPGTELQSYDAQSEKVRWPGYTAVMEIGECGQAVERFLPGDLVLCMGKHQADLQMNQDEVVKVPVGLSPESALLARLMNVSMTTLITARARPGDLVLVTGCGPVGLLAAQIFQNSGYEVIAVEPNPLRREQARSVLHRVESEIPQEESKGVGEVALVVECSGHEQAVLDACGVVRKGGEVVMVGVPWRKQTERSAHELLETVFRRYVYLRSGWEWELPRHATHGQPHSIFGNLKTALTWLAEGRMEMGRLMRLERPTDAQAVYQSLLNRAVTHPPFRVFDWRL